MVSKGWCTPEWPVEYGGGGLSFEEAKILTKSLKVFWMQASSNKFWHFDARTCNFRIRNLMIKKKNFYQKFQEERFGGVRDFLSQELDQI
jgi:hypothetical protein